jgi:hypothetical protein
MPLVSPVVDYCALYWTACSNLKIRCCRNCCFTETLKIPFTWIAYTRLVACRHDGRRVSGYTTVEDPLLDTADAWASSLTSSRSACPARRVVTVAPEQRQALLTLLEHVWRGA